MTIDRQEKCKELIKNNPTLSGNKIYEQSKKKGFGIQKSKFYELIREVRHLPEPTEEKKEKSIPIKYKFPELDKLPIPKKRGFYGIVEVIDKDEDVSYWIKYKNKKDLKKQFNKVKKRYKIKKLFIVFQGFRSYTEFRTEIFEDLLKVEGIQL